MRRSTVYTIFGIILLLGLLVIIGGAWWIFSSASKTEIAVVPSPSATNTQMVALPVIALPTDMPSLTPALTVTDTDTPTPTTSATYTDTPTLTPSLTATHSPTFTATPTTTDTPTATPTPSITSSPTRTPTPTIVEPPTLTPTATFTRAPGAPQRADLMATEYELTNILLIGSDRRPGQGDFRTDAMIIVSINKTIGTVNMLSLPRDLWVYIPDHGYDRLNTAALWGYLKDWEGGGGIALLKETIRYNFGIPIDYYALVNFEGFASLIDGLGGVKMAVACELADYRLIRPDLNPELSDNYEWVTIPVGIHEFDGDEALWYVRSRATTSDFDRNLRQQALLRAIWQQFFERDLWDTIPELWDQVDEIVVTDMTLSAILKLLPFAAQLQLNLIQSFYIDFNAVAPFTNRSGAAVLWIREEPFREIIDLFYKPPTLNQLFQERVHIEIVNQSGRRDTELVAAEVLAELGFTTEIINGEDEVLQEQTTIVDFTGSSKGSSLGVLATLFGIESEDISVKLNANTDANYRIVLGELFNACIKAPERG